MSLRDDLAKRILAMAFTEIEEDESGIRVVPKPPWYELAADECIRQMEWARREMHTRIRRHTQNAFDDGGALGRPECPAQFGPPITAIEGNLPLTIAPEDWRPE